MEDIITKVDIDVVDKNNFLEVRAKQCDKQSRFINATVSNGKKKIEIPESAQVFLNIQKPDGKHARSTGTVNEDGTVTVELTYQMLTVCGIAYCDISIEDEDGQKLTTQLFKLNIERAALSEEDIVSMDEYDVLTKIILTVEKLENDYNVNEAVRQKNEETRNDNEEKREKKYDEMTAATEQAQRLIEDIEENGATLENIINLVYPVGSICISTSSVNPQEKFGGVWTEFAKGKTLVGVDSAQSEFNAVEKSGGSKTHTLTVNEMPKHNHAMIDSAGNKEFGTEINQESSASRLIYAKSYSVVSSPDKMEKAGGDQAHNNLQPYITVYMWKRIS